MPFGSYCLILGGAIGFLVGGVTGLAVGLIIVAGLAIAIHILGSM